MGRRAWLLTLAVVTGTLTGCVERRFVITSDPPGAVVYRDGEIIGATPAHDHFTYYGKYKFTLVRDGCETLHVVQEIPPPWYERAPLDFFSENFYPGRIEDVRRFHYQLAPAQVVPADEVLRQAGALRERAKALEIPEPRYRPEESQ